MILSKETSPPCKRTRLNSKSNSSALPKNDDFLPQVESPDELVGKRVAHFTADGDKKGRWYEGVVVCLKPNSDTELVIKYDGDEQFYACDYSEFAEHELLQVIEIQPEWALGRMISQRFETESGDESWWERGRILSHKDGNYTVEYYDNENNQIEDDDYIVCDTITLELDTEYCNHDLRFH